MLSFIAAVCATLALALTGVMAGLFYAFSVSVMPGLDVIRAEHAIRAMQSINRNIQNPVFLVSFLFAPIAAAVTGVLLLFLDQTTAAIIFFLAAAIYVLGVLAPTFVMNVPMNEALDVVEVSPTTSDDAQHWSDYSLRWTWWNSLRTLLNLLSLLLIGLALFVWGRQG
jgi:uncharacterized membrane protein